MCRCVLSFRLTTNLSSTSTNSARPGSSVEIPVVATVIRDGGHHRGVGVLEAGLELGVVGGQGGQRGQMAAGGSAADRDEVRVPAVGRDVLLDPRQRAFDVDDVVGPGVQRGQRDSSSTRTPSRAKPGGSSRDTPGGGAIRSSMRRRVPATAPAPCRRAAGRGGARCRPGSHARAGRRTRCSVLSTKRRRDTVVRSGRIASSRCGWAPWAAP